MAGAISGATIAGLVAAVVGAGMQYKASSDAQRRQREMINQGLQRQLGLQREAEQTALDAAKNFETPQRQDKQEQIAQEIEEVLMAPVSDSQAIRAQEQTTQGDVSEDYSRAKTSADLETVKQTQALARLLGKTSSAGRLRLNEGIGLMDAGRDVRSLQSSMQSQQNATNIGAQLAGQVDPGMTFLGSVLQAGGTAYLGANGFGAGGGNAAQGLSTTGSTSTGLGTGLGFKAGAGTGLKFPTGIAAGF